MFFFDLDHGYLLILFLIQSFWNFPNFLFQLQQLLVAHAVDVDIHTALVLHAEHDFSEVLGVDYLDVLIYFSFSFLLWG